MAAIVHAGGRSVIPVLIREQLGLSPAMPVSCRRRVCRAIGGPGPGASRRRVGEPWRRRRLAYLALLALPSAACGAGNAAPPALPDAGLDAGDDASTIPNAGPRPGPCPPGELHLGDGQCQSAGIPPNACGEGFAPTGDGACAAILPAQDCPPGLMAVPGETECRAVAPCGPSAWGLIPVDAATEHVDGAYAGGDSDGSAGRPWTTIQQAVDAAEPGAIVAVAAGSYVEDVRIQDKPVRLWGKCPAEVEVVGTHGAFPAVFVYDAAGTEVRDLALVAQTRGVAVFDSADVLVDRAWIHDCGQGGLQVVSFGPSASVRLERVLVERVAAFGAEAMWGAELGIEQSVVRDTQPSGDIWGIGIEASADDGAERRSALRVRRSLVERNYQEGIRALASNVTVEDSLVRDTFPDQLEQMEGAGIVVTAYEEHGAAIGELVVRRSAVESSHSCGICAIQADTTIEDTVVSDTAPQAADDSGGLGIAVVPGPTAPARRPLAIVRSTLVERCHVVGLALAAVEATIEGLLVRDTAPEAATGLSGRGISIEVDPATGEHAVASLAGSVVESSHEAGLVVLGAEAVVEGTVVRDVAPRPADGRMGRGVVVQMALETLTRASLRLRNSRVEAVHEAGLYVAGADARIEDVVVAVAAAQPGSALFGDGVIASLLPVGGDVHDGAVELERCRIERSDRAAVASFGASISLASSAIDCNVIDLTGSRYLEQSFEFVDRGGNVCGCASGQADCLVLSSDLAPPEPM
ncbi:MAG: hypothetical protein HY744_34035 [Deltaproteobacteria bacterium]|nr:hypothetical protein [Deltaproteobacteria bacterium]